MHGHRVDLWLKHAWSQSCHGGEYCYHYTLVGPIPGQAESCSGVDLCVDNVWIMCGYVWVQELMAAHGEPFPMVPMSLGGRLSPEQVRKGSPGRCQRGSIGLVDSSHRGDGSRESRHVIGFDPLLDE